MQELLTLAEIPNGIAGIRATLEVMAGVVRHYRTDGSIRNAAVSIITGAGAAPKDSFNEARAVQEWVRDNIRYTSDICDVEYLADPVMVLRNRCGDCDDMATLAAALLQSIGFPVRFVAVGFGGDELSHVLLETQIYGDWVPIETTEPVSIGWFPPGVTSTLIVKV